MNANQKIVQIKTSLADLSLSFDVGHSSIGWAVLQTPEGASSAAINILGCGVVTFRADDCLASARRGYRRQRRHIRSTRQRIKRLKVLLNHLGVLNITELDRPGCAWPWQLAARVLASGKLLSWPELWDVLRWYAHNRGYDGNRRWSAAEAAASEEDTEKEENARTLMHKHSANSMAETFCKELGVEPLNDKKRSSMKRFKGLNAAFPRNIVEGEVRRILQAHAGKLKQVDANLERVMLGRDGNDALAWQAIACPALKLPKRYQGGILFGQLVPRFDNRIISECPISGEKVPSRNSPEFLGFRWAMQLANVRVAGAKARELRPLTIDERKAINEVMREQGHLAPGQFKDLVRKQTGCQRDNLETMLMHPDAKDALLLDPVQKLIQSDEIKPFWAMFPERLQKRIRGQWRRGKSFSRAQMRTQLIELTKNSTPFDAEVDRQLDKYNTKTRKKDKQESREDFLNHRFPRQSLRLDGRATYARAYLVKAYEEVMAGKHPKEEGGCLFITEEMRQAQLNREIAQQTNNHLVRHRLLILERLLGDILKEYAAGNKARVRQITIEVNRDLREMSGKTAKEKAQDLGLRIANHHQVVTKLEKALAKEKINGRPIQISAGLIRKARIAEDLGWKCPYTGQIYEPIDLVTRRVDKDHIVPRSDRASDSLDSLVITYATVNAWKARRTAMQFIEQEQGKAIPDLPNLSIWTLSRYKEFVDGLETYKGHDDDKHRKERRKRLMLLPSYEEKEFTPRDLTQTSQLVRLGAQALRRAFQGNTKPPIVVSLPGSVTGTIRKAWKVLGCLGLAAPQVMDENGEVKKKDDIRGITHLHHALDACVLGLAAYFIPNNGRIWELIVKRRLNEAEQKELFALEVFSFDNEGHFQLRDLHDRLKEQIRQRLAEKRVVQHIPARMDGLRVEQNTWRVVSVKDGEASLEQRMRQPDGSRPVKRTEEKVTKLLGVQPTTGSGKLKLNKGALVIPDNFGVALDPQPVVIPYHKVWPRLRELKEANGGKMPRILRNGQIIRVLAGKNFKGVWKVFSAKNNASGMALDIGSPDVVRLQNKTEGHKINVRLSTLIKDGLAIVKVPMTGIASPACPITSSA